MNSLRAKIILFNVLSVFCHITHNKCWKGKWMDGWMVIIQLHKGNSRLQVQ